MRKRLRPPGQPYKGERTTIAVRVPDDYIDDIDALAQEVGLNNRSDLVITLIAAALKREEPEWITQARAKAQLEQQELDMTG